MYCALIGDIVGSRQLDQRWEVQEKLKAVLSDVNRRFEEDLAAKFTITLGDEFQGLLASTEELLVLVDTIRLSMHPVKIRFGIGIGPMATKINEKAALGADGPAYHVAREGLSTVKALNNKYVQGFSDTRCYYYDPKTGSTNELAIFNAALSAIGFIADKWTEKQRDIIKELESSDLSQREIGKKLAITQSSVQRRLDSAGYYTYIKARELANNYLNDLWEGLDE